MGYFDGLTSNHFKTTQDGSRLFFPWGSRGSGYAIASEQDYERLRRQVKAHRIASFIVALLIGLLNTTLFKGGIFIIVNSVCIAIVFLLSRTLYEAWMWHLLPRLKASDERLSLRESWSTMLKAFKPEGPWTAQDPSLTRSRKVSD